MQHNLSEKFILSLLDENVRAQIGAVFDSIDKQPLPMLCQALNETQWFAKNENKQIAAGTINGLILGLMVERFSKNTEINHIFEGWLEQFRKNQGENVINFSIEKAGRR